MSQIRMTNDKNRRNDNIRMTNPATAQLRVFDIRASDFFCHSSYRSSYKSGSRSQCFPTDFRPAVATHFPCDCTHLSVAVSQHSRNRVMIREIKMIEKPGTDRARVVLLHSPKGLKVGRCRQSVAGA